ncbi:Histidine acid phosphatase, eukaryotic [Metarhizium album ARSEF 1941]|uniref:Histidine acid phosphatase, eukaryotic n=1 Tax=Metarhizium album (strain ARSEF 1941) TaxID=1081103 RepID=A0A0B2X064_METAS|nr:Histidine acid phosphatase, eukaryotic [Metarhizium album ARSEF 1941]KHN98480.1 Histidine acid phosphatase, eukaryotic [Metarhizium album ARSEF 1941]
MRTTTLHTLTWVAVSVGAMQLQTPLYSSYSFNPLQHLAGIAPYYEPADPPRDPNPPQGCAVTRAAYLVRHAAINANDFDYEQYLQPFLEKLGNSTVDWSKIPQLSFLATWEAPSFGEQELLTRTGKVEAGQLGLSISYRYPKLRLPQRVWTSSAERTVQSARGFVRGLEMDDNTINVVEISEGKEAGADSLTPYKSCKGYSAAAGSKQQGEYVGLYTAPIITRLKNLAPGFNFTSDDVTAMQAMCGYDTVIRGSSPFCSTDLFSPDEWLQFEYGQDIQYHYNTGYGSPYAGAIGFPWVNTTLDLLSADTSAQDLYISFTHRELPPTALVALGLFNNSIFSGGSDVNATMPLDQINYNRAWVSSRILPFLTNIAIERMNCTSNQTVSTAQNKNGSSSSPASASTYYRVLLNRSPQVLPGCFDGPGQSCSSKGLQTFMQQRADMFRNYTSVCGNTYGNSTDSVTFYTDSNNGTSVSKKRNLMP